MSKFTRVQRLLYETNFDDDDDDDFAGPVSLHSIDIIDVINKITIILISNNNIIITILVKRVTPYWYAIHAHSSRNHSHRNHYSICCWLWPKSSKDKLFAVLLTLSVAKCEFVQTFSYR